MGQRVGLGSGRHWGEVLPPNSKADSGPAEGHLQGVAVRQGEARLDVRLLEAQLGQGHPQRVELGRVPAHARRGAMGEVTPRGKYLESGGGRTFRQFEMQRKKLR